MLQGMPLSVDEPYLKHMDRFDTLAMVDPQPSIQVLVPSNNPTFNDDRDPIALAHCGWPCAAQAVPYGEDPDLMMIRMFDLLEFSFAGDTQTKPGDSGSPVVLWLPDGTCTFVGMHVAGDDRHSYVLPAWQIFTPGNYSGSLQADAVISF